MLYLQGRSTVYGTGVALTSLAAADSGARMANVGRYGRSEGSWRMA